MVFSLRCPSLILGSAFAMALAACGGNAEAPSPKDTAEASADDTADTTPGWFTEVPSAESGVTFRHETGATGELHLPEIMGSGLAVADLDGDGRLDLYLVSGTENLGVGIDNAEGPVNRFYRQSVDGSFEDRTAASGLGDPGYGMGVAVGDVDNDGDEDLYVANLDQDRLYLNRGDGSFEDATAASGAGVKGWSSSAAFLDYDRDGFLDLFVARYVAYDANNKCYDKAGRHEYCGPTAFPGIHDVLLRNRGDGSFEDVSITAGMAAIAHAGLGVVVRDFDDDGWPDIYVANDADPNEMWLNRHDGTFSEEGLLLGASLNAQGQPEAGMGVLAEDLDGDLAVDLFMTHLGDESNTFYRNLGGSSGFADASAIAGLGTTSTLFTGFGTAAFDADLDGDLDVAAANGRVFREVVLEPADLEPPWNAYAEPNLFYVNTGNGNGLFRLAQSEGRAFTSSKEVTRGLALGDLDGDGDLDLVTTNAQGPARIYRNEAPHQGGWLIVDAWDPKLQRRSLGAEIRVTTGSKTWLRTVDGASGYQSANDPRAHFGLGQAEKVEAMEVRWPDGTREVFPGVEANQALRLERGGGTAP